MAGSKLDSGMIARMVYDEDAQANRVVLATTETEISLSSEDDSIATAGISQSLTAGDHSVVGMKTACLYGTATVSVSPTDAGEDFVALTMTALTPITICARRMRIVGAGGTVVVQGV